jgi:hypothetical protein
MDHRRYYVISSTGGERGPYGLGHLQDALEEAEISSQDLVRTSMGTMLGTVADLLAQHHRSAEPVRDESGSRQAQRGARLVGVVIAVFALAGAAGLYWVRPAEIGTPTHRASTSGQAVPEVASSGKPGSAAAANPAPAPVVVPITYPQPMVELDFTEVVKGATPNTGSTARVAPTGMLTPSWPQVVATGPGPGSLHSVDFGIDPKPYAVEVANGGKALANLISFTLTGWVNTLDLSERNGGNRIICWRRDAGDGVDFSCHQDGSLWLGINEWNDYGRASSTRGTLNADPSAHRANWCFFAVTYDSQLPDRHVAFYFGTATVHAALDRSVDYRRGRVGPDPSAGLTIGHLSWDERQKNPVTVFRGLIAQVRIWGSDHDGTGALTLAQILAVQQRALVEPQKR